MVARSEPVIPAPGPVMTNLRRVLTLLLLWVSIAAQPIAAEEGNARTEQALPGTTPAGAKPAALPGQLKVIAQYEYIAESDGDTFDDPSLFLAYTPAHAQIWSGEFTLGAEIGGFLRDSRRSTYAAFYRFREDFDQVIEVSTEQLAGRGVVLFAGVRFIHAEDEAAEDRDMWEPRVGFDKYYGNYNFVSFRAVRDPRKSGRYSFVLANRFGARDWYVTLGFVPRTDGDQGYFVQGKWRWLRAGFGRYNQFDFTDIDRTVFNVGLEWQY